MHETVGSQGEDPVTGTGGEDRHQTVTQNSEMYGSLWGKRAPGKCMLSRGLRLTEENLPGSSFQNLAYGRRDGGVGEGRIVGLHLVFIHLFIQQTFRDHGLYTQ